MKEYLASAEEVLEEQSTSAASGLTAAEAQSRLASVGPNKLDEEEKTPMWKRFFEQMGDPMVIMLLVAAAISVITGFIQGEPEWADAAIILSVVILNSVLGVIQEAKSEQALEALQEMSAAQSKVIRDGKMVHMASSELVPGDVVLLEAGDSVPADCRVIESASMKIEEAALTGESVPVEKHADVISLAEGTDDVPLGDRKNMCYMGSTVVYGRGRAVVVGTGMNTEMGKIASALTSAKKELTPLQMKLNELSGILTKLVLAICVIIFAVDIVRHFGELGSNPAMMLDTFMVAVSLAVAAIPEGLVAVVTIVLSMGVTKMSRRQAIIRKMTAVETLGCTQIICSDKTGTLTQNKMTVVKHELAADEDKFLAGMALCSDAKYDAEKGEAVGEPTECALVNDAAKAGMTDLDSQRPRIGEAPFDSGRKMMSVVVKDVDGDYEQFTKGAPDVVIGLCTHVYDNGQVVELTDERREQILAANKAMADQALRVLALANRTYAEAPTDFSPEALEHDLVFCGLSGMIDPVRPEVTAAIVEAKEAGIRPVMITGDHIDTAVAIAKDLGIVEDASQAITGAELDKISDEDFKTRVTEISVYARVQPEHKARIVDAWKSLGNIVAMTGDGVNDAPSIKRADIGVGMGITGTDVTKNVADMVLADDNFATIINAVEEGRRIYDNIRKVIQFLLSANIAEVLSVFVATLIGFTIFQPVQLLWINLITDSLPALALGMEEAEGDVMKRKPRKASDGVFAGGMGIDIAFQGVIITILVLASFFAGMYFHNGAIELSMLTDGIADPEGVTMAFITLSMVEIFHSFNMRSRRASIFSMKTQNKWLWGAAALAVVLTVVPVEVDFLAEVFGFMTLDPIALFTALGLAFLIIPLMEIYKAVMRRVEKNQD
ncbi:MAG: cation-translocating P-type ATPase [Collinsella sp.]|uniref:Calcium-transporting ATPase 1 n=2 Tax=Collinsella intestinalis TaxID=147207 RepID=A0A5K1JC58_9ACTN|nr:cation-translocating P-type ATPase [Collinsella intestinalis]EEP43806.1 putative potassium/sodium efflux P-type ATPase, fungal-type [Collinsella intestinalis DSM 13280]MBS5146771.1 cation-translocating P-type ATPase [Collinsella intestinalis]MDO5363766.1 cation-translocating P-type ATPase [Collinsella sp.]VWM01494.1 Calcium-transporting ATPase 1 [Collinsella intestinalis]